MNSIIEPKKAVSAPPVELPEETFECPKHGSYSGKPIILAFLGNKKISPLCPQCEVERADAEERLGQKRRTAADMKKLADMNILKRDWGCDFDNFNAYTAELAKHVKTARAFAEKPGGKLVMLGNNGTGKNHLATAILRRTGGFMYTAYEIGVLLRQSYGGDSKEWEVLNALSEINLLVIDEIGRTKGSDFDLNWMSHVINKRHGNMLPTVLISNRHLKGDCPEGETGCPKCLENFFDNDVISRIIEDGIVMKFTGEDYRYKKRTQRRVVP